MSSKRKHNGTVLANLSPYRYEVDETRHILTKSSNSSPFVENSVSEFNCKRFHNTAIRENSRLKLGPQMNKTQCNNQRNPNHKYREQNKKLFQNSFVYV